MAVKLWVASLVNFGIPDNSLFKVGYVNRDCRAQVNVHTSPNVLFYFKFYSILVKNNGTVLTHNIFFIC